MPNMSDFMQNVAAEAAPTPHAPNGRYKLSLRSYEPRLVGDNDAPQIKARMNILEALEGVDPEELSQARQEFTYTFWMNNDGEVFARERYFNQALEFDVDEEDTRNWAELFHAAVGVPFAAYVIIDDSGKYLRVTLNDFQPA